MRGLAGRAWRDHSLLVIALGMAVLWIALGALSAYAVYTQEQEAHHQPFQWVGFAAFFGWEVFGEFIGETVIGIYALSLLTKHFREAGSPETGDDLDGDGVPDR